MLNMLFGGDVDMAQKVRSSHYVRRGLNQRHFKHTHLLLPLYEIAYGCHLFMCLDGYNRGSRGFFVVVLYPLFLSLFIMGHNLAEYRAGPILSKSYAASPAFLQQIVWEQDGPGHVLIDKGTDRHVIACMVGCVQDNRFNCGPTGNFSK